MSSVILESKKIKSVTASTFAPSICHEDVGSDVMICFFVCLFNVQFQARLFTLHLSPVYLVLLHILPLNNPAFFFFLSAVLSYFFPNLKSVTCFRSRFNCCLFICIHVPQETDKVVWYSHLFKNFPQFVVIHTIKSFDIINEAEVNVFIEFPWFSHDPQMLAIWSPVPLPFLNPPCTSGSSWFTYCWSPAWRDVNIALLACKMSTVIR